jgi:hypothetical protein
MLKTSDVLTNTSQTLSIDALTAKGPMVSIFYETTWVGGAILAIMLGIYLSVAMKQKRVLSEEQQEKATIPLSAAAPVRQENLDLQKMGNADDLLSGGH